MPHAPGSRRRDRDPLTPPSVPAGLVPAALLALTLLAAALPALVLAWRSALAAVPRGAPVVAGVLVVAGLAFLVAGGLPLVTDSRRSRPDVESGRWVTVLVSSPVLLAVLGLLLLAGAVAAVR